MRLRRPIAGCLLALALASALPAAALGDADPPSDILPTFDSYLPYSPKVAPDTAKELQDLIAAAKKKDAAFKVAIIASKADLGAVGQLLDGPAANYAKFLYGEIKTFVDGPNATLLTVMPGRGVGVAGRFATPAGRAAAARISVPKDANPTQLAVAAMDGMRAVAKANGATLPAASDSGGTDWTTIAVIALLVVLAAAGIALILRGRRPPPATDLDAA